MCHNRRRAFAVPPDHEAVAPLLFGLVRHFQHGRNTSAADREKVAAVRPQQRAIRDQCPTLKIVFEHWGRVYEALGRRAELCMLRIVQRPPIFFNTLVVTPSPSIVAPALGSIR